MDLRTCVAVAFALGASGVPAQEARTDASRTTCLTPRFQQEYYDRVTAATVKVIFEKIMPARAQLTPVSQALASAQQARDACRETCEPHEAALRQARDRYEKVKAESDALQLQAANEIVDATRNIRAEYAPCPPEKPNE